MLFVMACLNERFFFFFLFGHWPPWHTAQGAIHNFSFLFYKERERELNNVLSSLLSGACVGIKRAHHFKSNDFFPPALFLSFLVLKVDEYKKLSVCVSIAFGSSTKTIVSKSNSCIPRPSPSLSLFLCSILIKILIILTEGAMSCQHLSLRESASSEFPFFLNEQLYRTSYLTPFQDFSCVW